MGMQLFKMATRLAALFLIVCCCFQDAHGSVCKRKTILGKQTSVLTSFNCPEEGQAADKTFCCGDEDGEDGQYCCRLSLDLDHLDIFENLNTFTSHIWKVLATVAGIAFFILILSIVLCCVVPGCLLHKRRQGGTVYRSAVVNNPANGEQCVNVTVAAPLLSQPGGFAPQGGYPLQQQPMYAMAEYPGAQPVYPPNAGYTPQQAGYPPQPGYYPPNKQ